MNFLDIVLVIPLLYGFYTGYQKGFVRQLSGLVAVIAAVLFGLKLSVYVKTFLLNQQLITESWSALASFVLTFFLIVVAIKIVGRLIRKFTKAVGLGFLERILGAVFAVLKIFLIVTVLLFFFVKLNQAINLVPAEVINQSKVYPLYTIGFEFIADFWNSPAVTEPN